MLAIIKSRKSWAALFVLTSSALVFLSGCASATPGPAASSSTAPASSLALTLDVAGQEQLDWEWERVLRESPDAVRPMIDIVRFVDNDDWGTARESCMHDLGWPDVRATADGGLESGMIQNSQAGAHALAMYTCNAKYPMDPKYNVPLTDERLGELFDYFTDELQPCLAAEGYDTPAAPSRETFIDTYAETGGWNLYEGVAGNGQSEWNAINKKCPQLPVDFNE
ncbi:hypothetical protein [Cryobacterium sp. N21]|uniref:hypothetical protein n=1 Tax=Cryobacterium sp. N21 TaxID=2048289 RepID=UPI000CE55649|nr:hypothetical protein [Cryobacterium sp. N21]